MSMFSGRKEKNIGAAIREWLKAQGFEEKMDETRILDEYDKIVGPIISQHTIAKRIDKSVLYVKLDSASLRYELGYARDKLKSQLNKVVDKELIKNIVFS